ENSIMDMNAKTNNMEIAESENNMETEARLLVTDNTMKIDFFPQDEVLGKDKTEFTLVAGSSLVDDKNCVRTTNENLTRNVVRKHKGIHYKRKIGTIQEITEQGAPDDTTPTKNG
ncbi:1936_t:CDS:2, partial [Ambispora leptoticha]